MRFSLVCISSIPLRSTMDQSGSQRTSFQFSIDAYKPTHSFRRVKESRVHVGLSPNRKLLVDEHQDACRLLRSAISNGKRGSIPRHATSELLEPGRLTGTYPTSVSELAIMHKSR
jgi:hypothetical protein